QIQVVERSEQTVATVYTGIVVSYLDARETLPVVFDTGNLEYELTRKIRKIVTGAEPSAGFLIGRPGAGLSSEFNLLAGRLARSYTVREIGRGEAIPDDLSVLFVIGGGDLDDFDLYPVDSFIMRGGKALFAADGVAIDLARNLEASPYADQPLLRLLSAYGVEVGRELVLDSQCRRMPVQRNTGGIVVQSLEKYNHWVAAQGRGLSRTNPVTARLSGFDLYWPSPLTLKEPPGVASEVLASSGGDSWLMRGRFSTNPFEAPLFKSLAADSGGNYVLAAALRGTLPGGFAGRPVPVRNGVPAPGGPAPEKSKETRIIVVGDSEAATDLVRYSDSMYNTAFFENAADWLSGDDSLLEIRSRAARDTRLGRIEDPRARNAVVLFSRVVNIFLVPALLAGYGLVRALRRRSPHDR
ncbi:MAG: Gldg family protein, partial [Desulfococcus multivorans]|nr:Gldg family protein [Desulfococcus multivorans]